jgi:hypothetical protein
MAEVQNSFDNFGDWSSQLFSLISPFRLVRIFTAREADLFVC